jgi:hypothetical protein
MTEPTPDKKGGNPEVDLSAPDAIAFIQKSVPEIKAVLDSIYVQKGREPLRIFSLLAGMLGSKIYVRREFNAKIPYVTLADGALSLHVLPNAGEDVVVRYKAMIEAAIKPELIKLAKALEREAQDQVIRAAQKAIQELQTARQKLGGVEFPPMDERLLALENRSEGGEGPVISTVKYSGDQVRSLLDNVFKQK